MNQGEELKDAYAKFLETGIYRQADEDLRSLLHTAFVAGWCAARYPAEPANEINPLR